MTVLWLALALAGDPCRRLDPVVDAQASLGGPSWSVERPGFRLAVHDGKPYLTLYVAEPGAGLTVERFEAPVRVALDDGTVVDLFPTEGSGVSRSLGYVRGDAYVLTVTPFALRTPLSREALHVLAGARVEEVRYRLVTEARRVDVSKAFSVHLQRAAACLANTGW